jgi:hypothetical protein
MAGVGFNGEIRAKLTMLDTGLIGLFYARTLHGLRSRAKTLFEVKNDHFQTDGTGPKGRKYLRRFKILWSDPL